MQLGILRLWFYCLTRYVISTHICGKNISSNFNIDVLQKNSFLPFHKGPGQKPKLICCLKYTGKLFL